MEPRFGRFCLLFKGVIFSFHVDFPGGIFPSYVQCICRVDNHNPYSYSTTNYNVLCGFSHNNVLRNPSRCQITSSMLCKTSFDGSSDSSLDIWPLTIPSEVVCLMRLILLRSDWSKFRKFLSNNYLSRKTSRKNTSCSTSRDFIHILETQWLPFQLGKYRKYQTKNCSFTFLAPITGSTIYFTLSLAPALLKQGPVILEQILAHQLRRHLKHVGFRSLEPWKPQIFSLLTLTFPPIIMEVKNWSLQ